MTDQLPPPLVPPDVDLTGYGWMPMHGHRLFGSEFNARCSDAEWRAGVTLWWAAWNQVPAASLPDDDVALARLADLGRDVKGWRKLRANALHGFVKCSDGRLYHKALAQFALEAWDKRVRERNRKAKWRAGRERPGDGDKNGTGTRTETGTGTSPETGQGRQNGRDGTAERRGEERKAPYSPPKANGPETGTSDAVAIVRSFHGLRQELCSIDPPKTLSPKEISIAQGWIDAGASYYPVLDLMTRRMQRMIERREAPPNAIQFFSAAVREAIAAGWPGYDGP